MSKSKPNFKSLQKNYGYMSKNYTLLIISTESTENAVTDNLAVEGLKNKKLVAKQGLRGKSFYTIEEVQPSAAKKLTV